jgi:hypothetical protein
VCLFIARLSKCEPKKSPEPRMCTVRDTTMMQCNLQTLARSTERRGNYHIALPQGPTTKRPRLTRHVCGHVRHFLQARPLSCSWYEDSSLSSRGTGGPACGAGPARPSVAVGASAPSDGACTVAAASVRGTARTRGAQRVPCCGLRALSSVLR